MMATYLENMQILKSRYLELKKRLRTMAADPLNWPVAGHPLFEQYTNVILDMEPEEDNVEMVLSGVNKLIMVIDGEIPVTSLAV